MRVTKIQAENFQALAKVELDLTAPVTLVLGANNAGKTSLARAFELAVRGEASVTRGGAALVSQMIRTGEARAEIRALIEQQTGREPVLVRRIVGAKGISTAVNGSPVTKDVFDFYAPAGLLDPRAAFGVLCSTSGFFDLAPEKQREVLEGLVDQAVTAEDLGALPFAPYLPGVPKTLHDMEAAYDIVYQKRRDLKAQTPRTGAAPAEAIPDIPAIEAKLTLLRAEERALLSKVGESAGAQRELTNQLADKRQVFATLATALAALDRSIEVDVAAATGAPTAAEIQGLIEKNQVTQDRAKRLKDWSKALGGVKGKCVISAEVPCPLNSETKGLILTGWSKELEKIDGEWGGAMTDKDFKLAQEREKSSAKRVDERVKKTAELSKETAQVEEMVKRLKAMPAGEPDAIKTLRARIEKGEGNLALARRLAGDHAAYQQQTAAAVARDKQLDDLETLCKALGPKGLRERLLGARLGTIEEGLNVILKTFGISLKLQAEPWMVALNGVPSALASASERFRAGVAFQLALADLTGIGFVVIDAADVLDKQNRAALFGLLETALNGTSLQQAIVLATMQDTSKPLPAMPAFMQVVLVEQTGGASQIRAAA